VVGAQAIGVDNNNECEKAEHSMEEDKEADAEAEAEAEVEDKESMVTLLILPIWSRWVLLLLMILLVVLLLYP